jgi:hypothetical protein
LTPSDRFGNSLKESPLLASDEYNRASREASERREARKKRREMEYKMNPETSAALGNVIAELAKQELVYQVSRALEDSPKEADQLAAQEDLRGDLDDFLAVLMECSPKRLLENFHYMNPTFDLQHIMSQKPLAVLECLLNARNNDRADQINQTDQTVVNDAIVNEIRQNISETANSGATAFYQAAADDRRRPRERLSLLRISPHSNSVE